MLLEPSKILDSYELTMADMKPEDVPSLHELSVCVNWPHRARDWELLQDFGKGLVLRAPIDRTFGTAMWFPMSSELVSIGMVITSPRLQRHGAGMWLMKEVLSQTQDSAKILNATKAAYPLYLSLGFQPIKRVYQHNGIVHSLPDGPDLSRPYQTDDFEMIVQLDEVAYGANRRDILAKLVTISDISVMEKHGQVVGFAMRRPFGKGHVIGPVVAETEEDCLSLIRPHVDALQGQFARMDTRADEGPFRQFLQEAGIVLYDQVTTMTLGSVQKQSPMTIYGLVNQALG